MATFRCAAKLIVVRSTAKSHAVQLGQTRLAAAAVSTAMGHKHGCDWLSRCQCWLLAGLEAVLMARWDCPAAVYSNREEAPGSGPPRTAGDACQHARPRGAPLAGVLPPGRRPARPG